MVVGWPFSFPLNLYHDKYIRLSSEIGTTKIQPSVKIVAEHKLESFFVINSRKLLISINDMLLLHILTLVY